MAKIINGIVQLDNKDKDILSVLNFNARLHISKIAKKINISEEVINYRIKNLIKLGVIKYFYPAKDYCHLGYMYIKFLIKLQQVSVETENKFINFLEDKKDVAWLIKGDGKYDIILGLFARRLVDLEKTYNDIIFNFGDIIIDINPCIGSIMHQFKHNYLYNSKDDTSIILGKVDTVVNIDNVDEKILELLNIDGRMPIKEMSRRLKISPNTVRYRLENLEKNQVILAHKVKIDVRRLGYQHYKIFVFFNKIDKIKLNKIVAFLAKIENVIYITHSISSSFLEFEAIYVNKLKLNELIEKLKKSFSNTFFNFDIIHYYDQYKVN